MYLKDCIEAEWHLQKQPMKLTLWRFAPMAFLLKLFHGSLLSSSACVETIYHPISAWFDRLSSAAPPTVSLHNTHGHSLQQEN